MVESRREKGRGNKTINDMACNQDKKRFLRTSVHEKPKNKEKRNEMKERK